jgi:hypothetical protein
MANEKDENSVTIQNLEVSFQVEGEGDEAVFAKLFEKYVNRWSRLRSEAKARQARLDCDRSLVKKERVG